MYTRGFLLVEVMLALSILAAGVPAVSLSLYGLQQIQETNRALIPVVSAFAASTTILFRSATAGVLSPAGIDLPDRFTRENLLVAPTETSPLPRSIRVALALTDPGRPLESCDPFVSAPWNTAVAYATRDLSPSDLFLGWPDDSYRISGIAWANDVAVISAGSTGRQDSPTIAFVPLSRYGVLGSAVAGFDNASTSRVGYRAVLTRGTTAFAANAFGSPGRCIGVSCAQLHRFSLNGTPHQDGSLQFSTTTPPFAYRVGGATAGAVSLAIEEGLLAVGLERTERGMEFNLVDAETVRWISGVRIGRSVSAIAIRNGFAYVATDDPDRELVVIDIRSPEQPTIATLWDAPGARGFGLGSAIRAFGHHILLGRSYVGNAAELALLSWNPPEPAHLRTSWDAGSARAPESIRAIETVDWLVAALGIRNLALFTRSAESLSPRESVSFPGGWEGVSLTCIGESLFVGLLAPSSGASKIVQYRGI